MRAVAARTPNSHHIALELIRVLTAGEALDTSAGDTVL